MPIDSLAKRLQRRLDMLAMQEAGQNLQQIADAYGLSRERVRQILEREPGDNGSPRQLARKRASLVEKRDLWSRHPSPAGQYKVDRLTAEIEALDAQIAEQRKPFPVTDPDLDAPDGAVVDGFERVGESWEPSDA